jgi:hypothetical protein
MPNPGVTTSATNTPTVYRADQHGIDARQGITLLAAAARTIPKGQALGKIAASGKYTDYNDAAIDGTAVCTGFLTEAHTFAAAGDLPAVMDTHGGFIAANCTDLDAAGQVDLAGKCWFS